VLLSLDGTLVVQLLNFLIFLVVLNAIFLRPVGSAIAKRRAYVDGITSEIKQFSADVKALYGQAEERRAAARREADTVLAEARSQAQARAAELTADYESQAAQLAEEAHAQVAREIAEASTHEDRIVAGLADELLARAVGVAA
jgi:F-type H+-transporting ATPase subunit b